MASRDDEASRTVLAYRAAGAARDSDDPAPNPWLVTSWSAFVAAVIVVVGGALWLRRPGSNDGYGDGITYAMAIVILGLLSVACLIGTSLALLLNRGRRDTALALIPWVLTILTYATPLLIAFLA